MPVRCLRICQRAWLYSQLACKDSPGQEEKDWALGRHPCSNKKTLLHGPRRIAVGLGWEGPLLVLLNIPMNKFRGFYGA